MQVPGPPRWGAYGAPADQQYQQYVGGMQQAGVMPPGAMRWRASSQQMQQPGVQRAGNGMQQFNPAPGPPPGKVHCRCMLRLVCGKPHAAAAVVQVHAAGQQRAGVLNGPPTTPSQRAQGGRPGVPNGTRQGMVAGPHDYAGHGHAPAAVMFNPFMMQHPLMMQHQQQHSPWAASGMMQQQVRAAALGSSGLLRATWEPAAACRG